jgi:cellulose synthase operon protein C
MPIVKQRASSPSRDKPARTSWTRWLGALAVAASALTHASPSKSATPAGGKTKVSPPAPTPALAPATERAVQAPNSDPHGTGKAATSQTATPQTPGAMTDTHRGNPQRGPLVPEALRAHLKLTLGARVVQNLAKVRGLRHEALDLLTKFLSETPPNTDEYTEALVRAGELSWENEREAYLARFGTWEQAPKATRATAPEPDYRVARQRFAQVLRDYPNYRDRDLVLYIDGFLALETGRQVEADDRFAAILRGYPNSRFVPDAHMAQAEALFGAENGFAPALAEYEEVLKAKSSSLYGLALFKSAWCLWRLNRNDEATVRFLRVFELGDYRGEGRNLAAGTTNQRGNENQLEELQGEALRYLVEVFAEDERNTAEDMHRFLLKLGGERFAARIVRTLGETYYDQSHYERGVEAYELLLKLDPGAPDAVTTLLLIAAGHELLDDAAKVRATYERGIVAYTKESSWSRLQADPRVSASATLKVEAALQNSALALHGKAQRDKSKVSYEAAAKLYALYLTRFQQTDFAKNSRFYLADLELYHLDSANAAATHYMDCARSISVAEARMEPAKTLKHDAIYNALAALERARAEELERRRKGGSDATVETEVDRSYAEALNLYAQSYPEDAALPSLFFRQGKLYYDSQVYDPAVRIFGSLLEKFPQSAEARSAGELMLDAFNKSRNFENIELWARKLRTLPAFQNPGQQKRLEELTVQAVFKQGEAKSQAGTHGDAAIAYLRAAKEFPTDTRAAQACVNAELEAQKAFDINTLKEAASLVIGPNYRDKPEAPIGAWVAASTLQSMGLFADAAEYHEAIANFTDRSHPYFLKFEHAKDAAFNAVLLRATLGDRERAIANGTHYLQLHGTSADADEVYAVMARAELKAGRAREAMRLLTQYLSKPRSAERRAIANVQLALAAKLANDQPAQESALRAAAALAPQKSTLGVDGRAAVAQAKYLQGEALLAQFEAIQIQGDVKQLAIRLKKKTELLKLAAGVFLTTATMGTAEWTTAALYQVGHAYESFAQSLRDAPPPADLAAADKEAFQQQIDEFVVPIEERALEAFESGWKKAIEIGIYNQWTAKLRESLGRLNSELYPPLSEIGVEVRTQGTLDLPGLLAAPRRGVATMPSAAAPAKSPSAATRPPASGAIRR